MDSTIIVAIIAVIPAILTIILSRRKTKVEDLKIANAFIMKVLFEIIDILEGKKINGQIKELRKEAQKFNIEN